jgi:two-component system NtrC family sensor kinase
MRFRMNLGALVLLTTVTVVLLFGSINLYWVRLRTTEALTGELEKRALHVAEAVAQQAVDAILVEDRLLLKHLVEETRSLDAEIAYIFLVGPSGELAAHTFDGGFPAELLTANQLPADRHYMVRRIVDAQGREQPIRDLVVPIAGGYAGFAHVGFRESLILSGVRLIERAVAGMVAVFIVLGLVASILFARLVSRPLLRLTAAAGEVNLEAFQEGGPNLPEFTSRRNAAVRIETEVDRLAEEFRLMVHRLSAATRQLKQTQAQLILAEKLSTIGTIASGLAHELSNPLAGLRNCLRRIQREPENAEQLLRYLSTMQESAEHMQRVLNGLLDLARPRRPDVQRIALQLVLDRVILLAGHRLAEVGIVPRREIHPDALVIPADEYQLEQVLLNLILNACDSLEQRMRSEPGFSPDLLLSAACENAWVHIDVVDTGLGIDPENLPRLFDPFFTTKEPGKGTGLGLSIARNIIREHGGDIEIESLPGVGARFRIVLGALL